METFRRPMRTAAATLALSIACALASPGRAAPPEPQPFFLKSEILDRPQLGATATADAGQAMVEKGRQNTYDGLELSSEVTWGDGVIFRKVTIQPGRLKAAQRDKKYIYYFSDRMNEDTWPKPITPL